MKNQVPGIMAKANELVLFFTEKEIEDADLIETGPDQFNLIRNARSVTARIIDYDGPEKKVKVEVDGEFYHIEIKNGLDQMLDKMGFSNVLAKQVKEIKAPMPGLVLDIAVEVGQEVKNGDRILILEAMKMENSITIHANATIKKILVVKGQPVEKGQVLVELD